MSNTERTLLYSGLSADGNIAVDYDLSKINHRLYRQSKCYYGTVRMLQINPGDEVEIYTLADTWYNRRAYMMAMENYFNSRKEEIEIAGGVARWADFRVCPGQIDGVSPNRVYKAPIDPSQYSPGFTSSTFTAGEYIYSRMPDSAGNDEGFSWGEPATDLPSPTTHYPFTNAWNIITEFNKAKNVQASPENVSIGIPYGDSDRVNVEGVDTQEQDDVLDDGNEPPYNADDFPDTSVWVQRGVLGSNVVSANQMTLRTSTGLIPIPCGIVLYKVTNGTVNVQIEIKAGQYKGVHTNDWGTPKLVGGTTWKVN